MYSWPMHADAFAKLKGHQVAALQGQIFAILRRWGDATNATTYRLGDRTAVWRGICPRRRSPGLLCSVRKVPSIGSTFIGLPSLRPDAG